MAKSNLVKYVALTMFTLSASFACADMHKKMKGQDDKDVLSMIGEQNIRGEWQGKVAPRLDSNGPYITADFLWWNANEDNIEYALQDTITSLDATTGALSVKEKALDIRSKWEPGVRVGFGWLFGTHDQWELSLDWTYFNANQSHSRSSSDISAKYFRPTWSPALLGAISSSASGHWRVKMNTLDLDLGRSYFVSRHITVKPHMGVRGAWIAQKYRASYDGIWTEFDSGAPLAPVFLTTPTSFKARQSFAAGGVRAGFDANWNFTRHWGIFGQVSGSLLYGNMNVKERFNGARVLGTPITTPVLATTNVRQKGNFNRVRANFEALLGLQFETDFGCNDRYHFSLGAAYELSQWFQQNYMSPIIGGLETEPLEATVSSVNNNLSKLTTLGDLSFQGLTVKAAFYF